MNNELNARLIDAASRMLDYLNKDYETTQKLESDNASRIVWLVAIAGFVLVNLPNLNGGHLPPIYHLPWIITATLGVVTHWLYRNMSVQDLKLYTIKREQLTAYILDGPDNAILDHLNSIISNQTSELKRAASDLRRAATLTWILETATVTLLVISFGFVIHWFLNYLY